MTVRRAWRAAPLAVVALGVASLAGAQTISLSPIATGLGSLVAITHAGDGSGRLFFTIQNGVVRVYNGSSVLATPFLDIQSLVLSGGEQGLLSVAFHPNYESNGFFFVNYTRTPDGATVIARYQVSSGNPNVADPASARVLMVISQPAANHNGGQLQFGPDGYLYIGMGDGGGANDTFCTSQNDASQLGKMLRVDVNQNVDVAPYFGIPPTNPFFGQGSPRDRIWARGLRNPWRFSFDRLTGDLFIGDVGQSAREEIDFQANGAAAPRNYGWSIMEGTLCASNSCGWSTACNDPSLVLPILERTHAVDCAITGGYRYRGLASSLAGKYVYSDYCSGDIRAGTETSPGTWTSSLLLDTALAINTFGEDEAGELYVGHYGGTAYRMLVDPPGLSISDATVTEGDSGSVNATFTVTLSSISSQTITVNYATTAGTATAGVDYTSVSGVLTIPAGQPSGTIQVPVLGDLSDEPDETFTVSLSNPVNATLADAQGLGTITDNDPPPTLSIDDVTKTEGDTGSSPATFTVSVSVPSGRAITVNYATTAGTATANVDYTPASGMLTIPAGASSGTIQVPVLGDLSDEADETFTVTLSSPVNASLADAQGLGTITDNDPPPTLAIDDVTMTEGDTGSSQATFTVSVSVPSGRAITVNYATTAGTATANVDYTPASGMLTIPAGASSGTIQVPVLGDRIDEPDETFTVTLSNPSNATLADASGLGTIADDDSPPAVSIDDTFTPEGNAGSTPANFTVSLSGASGFTVQVNFATADGSANAPADYLSNSGTLTFPPGTLTQPVTVQVVGDAAIEPDEDFQVNLTSPVNATIGDGQGIGTISDDDAPSLSLIELEHGSELSADFQGGTADLYRLAQRPRSSYEVVVDEVSGDAVPPSLQRLAGDNVTVLQAGMPVGFGSAVSMRWENRTNGTTTNQHIRIASGGCTVGCGADDTYRVRVYETTGRLPRFNNSGSQITVLILQNPTDYAINGDVDFWAASGAHLASRTFSLAARGTLVLNTSTVSGVSGVSGALTVSNDGRFGDLVGKAVALEPATGFSFDTPLLVQRVR